MNFSEMVDEIPYEVHRRLKTVYLTLFYAMLSSTFGSFMQWISVAGGEFTVLSYVASLILIYFTPPRRLKTKVLLLTLAAYSFGASISAFTNYLYKIDQRYVLRLLSGATIGSGNFLYRTTTTRERIKQYCFVLMISAIASILLDSNTADIWVIHIHTQQTFFMAMQKLSNMNMIKADAPWKY
ncbi:hypothetical protein MTR67_032202 [Solanum verrucosum]|uniref:Uncharacterized protein n=1 Tax=Solanum verrucosum TaxID=315347 RepID=A0AAF0U406_SOLVR|nr:hypothetical protein MTR67_032202 [Solanum verrucosum]